MGFRNQKETKDHPHDRAVAPADSIDVASTQYERLDFQLVQSRTHLKNAKAGSPQGQFLQKNETHSGGQFLQMNFASATHTGNVLMTWENQRKNGKGSSIRRCLLRHQHQRPTTQSLRPHLLVDSLKRMPLVLPILVPCWMTWENQGRMEGAIRRFCYGRNTKGWKY
jgi:hypothetical protein